MWVGLLAAVGLVGFGGSIIIEATKPRAKLDPENGVHLFWVSVLGIVPLLMGLLALIFIAFKAAV